MSLKRFVQPPNYGRQTVTRAPSTDGGVEGLAGLGKQAGRVPADRRGSRSNGVKVRR